MMRLRCWIPLRLIDNLFYAGDLAIVGIGQKPDIVVGVRRQHLGHRAELGGKIWMGQKKTHGKWTYLVELDFTSNWRVGKAMSRKNIIASLLAPLA
jgi:hypothetical protein